MALLLSLGTWQLERKAWKEQLIAALGERLKAAPVELPPPSEWSRLTAAGDEFRRVRVRADFRTIGDALVYTSGSALRDDVKAPGYFVLMAGRLAGGEQHRRQSRLRQGPRPARCRRVRRRSSACCAGPSRRRGSSPTTTAPTTSGTCAIRSDGAGPAWGTVAPFYIEQESPVPPGGVPHPAPLRVNLPNNHLQYAMTWYGLALVLVGVFAAWLLHRRRQQGLPGRRPGLTISGVLSGI